MAKGNVSRPPRTTPVVRISFPQVFTPKTFMAGQVARYSVTLMFKKSDKEHMTFLNQLHKDAAECLAEKWPDEKTRPRIPMVGADKSPIKDGDTAVDNQGVPIREKYPEQEGHYIVRASTTSKPRVVDRNRVDIQDTNEIFGGCYVKANINAYTFDQPQNKGVTIGLNGIQKWADGESFGGGRPPVDEMFEVSGADDPANYEANPFSDGDVAF